MTNQPIEEKWKRDLSRLAIKYGTGTEIRGRCEIYEIKELTAFIENLLEQERKRMSEALTVSLDTSVMLDGWEKYWIDAENCRYIEGCVECGNSKRIKEAIINK